AAIHLWNAVVRLMVFGTFGHTLSALKAAYDREKTESRTDSLTGAANRRQFIDALEREAVRSRRYAYPLALAYLDLDNFKQVNDHWGHAAGDRVLQQIAHQTKTALRIPDLLVRLGGDEFAILMPHTDEIAAKAVLARIYRELTYLNQQSDWGVGFSIGLISCDPAPKEIEQLIHQADQLMYRVKASGKNRIEHQPFQVPQDS
ncbi:MAG: GGDEF domain-containing protein, partial [Cyanobacteria bacterium P01_D01_bin.128]